MPEENQGIRFDTPTDEFGRPPQQNPGFDLTGKMIQWGFAKDRQQAQYVLIGVAVVVLVIAYFIYHSLSGGSSVPTEPRYSMK